MAKQFHPDTNQVSTSYYISIKICFLVDVMKMYGSYLTIFFLFHHFRKWYTPHYTCSLTVHASFFHIISPVLYWQNEILVDPSYCRKTTPSLSISPMSFFPPFSLFIHIFLLFFPLLTFFPQWRRPISPPPPRGWGVFTNRLLKFVLLRRTLFCLTHTFSPPICNYTRAFNIGKNNRT